jgi:glutathione S-transferase
MLLYDNPASSNALKVRFLLAELDLAYDRHEVPMLRPRPDDYVALNPFTGIPTLDDDGFVLTESNAILRYLALRERREDLYPTERRGHARVNELLDRFALTVRPAFFKHEAAALGFKLGVGFGAVPNDPERAAEIAGQIAPQIELLETVLSDGEYALGGDFTIADCAIAPVLFRTTKSGLDLSAYPKLSRLRDTLLARPSFVAAGPVT